MKKNKIKQFIIDNKYILLIMIVIFFLVFLFPYSGDDWAWGSQIGLDRLKSTFSNYNGRYFGNLIVLILTRSNILRIIVITLTIIFICILSNIIIDDGNNKLFFYMPLLLFFLMPVSIFRQSIVWTSGFANYGITSIFLLLYIYINKDVNKEIEKKSNIKVVLMFLLAFISGLFMENFTIFNIIISMFICVYYYFRYKKHTINNISYFIGALTSSIVMFSNGAYKNILTGVDDYRTISSNIIERIINVYFDTIQKLAIQDNFILNAVIVVVLFILVYNYVNKAKNNKNKKIVLASMSISATYLFYHIAKMINNDWEMLLKYTKLFDGIFTCLFYIALLIIPLYAIKNQRTKERLIFYWISFIVIIAPLLLVTPIGPRNFFLPYILLILYICEIINYIINGKSKAYKNIYICKTYVLAALSVVVLMYYFSIYGYIYKYYIHREKYVLSQMKSSRHIKVPELPYSSYVHVPNPKSKIWNDRFKLFYNIETDIKIEVVSISDWKKISKK